MSLSLLSMTYTQRRENSLQMQSLKSAVFMLQAEHDVQISTSNGPRGFADPI